MARSPQSESVEGGNTTRQAHLTSTATGTQGTITEKPHGDTAGDRAQDGFGNGTFVVGMLVRCEVCGKKFINSFYLNKHIEKRHGGHTYYSEELPEAGIPRQVTATVPLQSEKGNSSPSALMPYSKADSRGPAPDDVGDVRQEEMIELHSTRNRHLACGTRLGHFPVPQYSLEQNEVFLSKLQNSNEKVKAEVHKEVNDVLKTFQAMLKNEIRGLQTQLAGLEANEEKKFRETIICKTPVSGEPRRHRIVEVTSDPDEEATRKTPLCAEMSDERRGGQKARPGSAPERKLASVRSSPCPERKTPRDAKETLRGAIRTLLTYSHREFFLRAQMTKVVKHNSKPLPEEIERHLGLPSLSISSQLAKSFLKEGFQHCHRSGLTTGNAPQNFDLVAGSPPLFGPDNSFSYYLKKNKDFPQRRFSLKLTRLRDRLRMRPLSPAKIPPPSASAAYMGVSALAQRPLHLPLVHRQLGYRQLVQPLQPLSYPPCPSLLPAYPHVDGAARSSALVHEDQFSKPFEAAQQSPARRCPDVDVKSYTPDRTPPHVGVQRVSAQQGSQSPEVQSSRHTMCVLVGRSTLTHPIPNRGMSSSYACSGPASSGRREPLKERAKSVVEVNCVRPAYPAEAELNEPSLHGKCNLDCSKSLLCPCNPRAEGGAQQRAAWPCPSSWISVPSRGPGDLPLQQAGSSPRVIPGPRSLSATRVSVREERDGPNNSTSAHLLPRDSDAEAVDPESSTFYAKKGIGRKENREESSPVEASRRSLHHQDLWQYAVHERFFTRPRKSAPVYVTPMIINDRETDCLRKAH